MEEASAKALASLRIRLEPHAGQRAARLRLELVSGPRTTGDGYYEAVIVDLFGNHIEITI